MTLDELQQWAHSANEISHQESRAFELLARIARSYQEEIRELHALVENQAQQIRDLQHPKPDRKGW